MKKTIIIARVGLVLLSALIVLPILFTFLYSVFSPEEMIDYLNMRSQYSAGYMEISSFNILHFEQKCFPRGDSEFGLSDSLSREEHLGCCL